MCQDIMGNFNILNGTLMTTTGKLLLLSVSVSQNVLVLFLFGELRSCLGLCKRPNIWPSIPYDFCAKECEISLNIRLPFAPVQGSIKFARNCQILCNNDLVLVSLASLTNSFDSSQLIKDWFIFSLEIV